MKALLIFCSFGFIIISANQSESFVTGKVIVQDTTELAVWKERALSAERESYMQKKNAEKMFAKVNELNRELSKCKAEKN
jgi:hypothetical protein